MSFFFFFFNDTATTEIYTLSLHDALPILPEPRPQAASAAASAAPALNLVEDLSPRSAAFGIGVVPRFPTVKFLSLGRRSEEHTSELQSQSNLVCRLLLEKKKKN